MRGRGYWPGLVCMFLAGTLFQRAIIEPSGSWATAFGVMSAALAIVSVVGYVLNSREDRTAK